MSYWCRCPRRSGTGAFIIGRTFPGGDRLGSQLINQREESKARGGQHLLSVGNLRALSLLILRLPVPHLSGSGKRSPGGR